MSPRWTAVALAAILLATLTPQMGSSGLRQDFFAPLIPGTRGAWRDVLQNVLLYMPLGLIVHLGGRSWFRTALVAASLSLATEVVQYVIPGRDPSASDIVMNVIGASIGWLTGRTALGAAVQSGLLMLQRALAASLAPRPRAAAALSLAWCVVVSAAIAATCYLLSPALPPPFYYLVTGPFMDTVPGPLRIGGDGGATGSFSGSIDEVRIYAGARSAAAIQRDMQQAVDVSSREPGLIAAYGFDEADAGLARAAGDGPHDASVSGAKWSPSGRFGGALVFDGHGPGAAVSDFPQNLDRSMTLEAWVNPTGRQIGRASILAHAGDTYVLRASSPSGALAPSGGGRFGENPRELRLRRRISANTWTHLATTYDGRAIVLFVNGKPFARQLLWSSHHPVRAELDDISLGFGAVRSPERVRSILSSGFTLNVVLRCGSFDSEPAPAFAIVGVQSRDVLVVEAAGTELRVRASTRGTRLGLAPVTYRIPDALSGCVPGGTVAVALRGPLQNLRLDVGDRPPLPDIKPGIASAWAFLLDSRFLPAPLVAALSIGYLAVLALPFGFWARPAWPTLAGGALLTGALVAAPGAWGIPSVDPGQIAGIVFGCFVGACLWRVSPVRRGVADPKAP